MEDIIEKYLDLVDLIKSPPDDSLVWRFSCFVKLGLIKG